jgi:hypothetical protein
MILTYKLNTGQVLTGSQSENLAKPCRPVGKIYQPVNRSTWEQLLLVPDRLASLSAQSEGLTNGPAVFADRPVKSS